jgi:anion-transporting  ArsA/GET3 family ATPase
MKRTQNTTPSSQNSSPDSTIDAILNRRKIIITCGTGGVGKTTLSAALGIRAALLGKRAVVVTIDPAKRLSTSLGLQGLGDHPTDLTPQIQAALEQAKALGLDTPKKLTGTLAAIVPDTRKTFETFVQELAPSPEAAQRVMRNPIFQIFAKEFSGTNEYMALERLHALDTQGEYDCIILDTPPTRNTLAFLEAPKVLAQFFEEKLIRWLVLPANQILATGMKKALGILEKLTGASFMTHLFDFASGLFSVQIRFTANLKKINQLMESPQVGFLMVTTLSPTHEKEVDHFIQVLKNHHLHFEGVLFNRTLAYLKDEKSPTEVGAISAQSDSWREAYALIHALQERERRVISNFMHKPIPVCAKLPELARDVHSVEDLFHVALAFHADSRLPGHSS